MRNLIELKPGVSVIICCCNSGWIIARCLEALKKQVLPSDINWEVVLVDNNCTDDTVKIAAETMRDSGIDFRIVEEKEPGLANAREKGISEVKYKYVVYCDDDNLLCSNYLSTVFSIFESDQEVGAIGGKGVAEFESEPDPRILPHITGYAIGSQLDHKNWLFGAGMALRTELVRDVYTNQKRFLVGRKGGELLSGDDSELAYSIVLRGYETFPTDDVSYIHVLKADRLTWDYCNKMFAGFDKAEPALDIMRMVLAGGSFFDYAKNYLRLNLRYIKYRLLYKDDFAKRVCESTLREIMRIRYWGVFKLWMIYNEWMRLKRKGCK